jgi:nucleoside 2-deoxyribosyltransferase
MTTPVCFIASAFGYDDVDTIFSKAIVPVLKELKLRPCRVDKINHNDKIDSKIIELMHQCDFAIVDLTYARPSAYFEAGYVEGMGKKVIYICRKDHFLPKESDTLGTNRVHFDLITKNIISWTNPDALLKKKLKTRISLIARPLFSKMKASLEDAESKREFETMSLNKRLTLMENTIVSFLHKKNFNTGAGAFMYNSYYKGKTLLRLSVDESILQDQLQLTDLKDLNFLYKNKYAKVIRVYCAIKTTPKSRIEKALRLYDPLGNNCYQNGNSTVFIIDGIDSLARLNQKLSAFKP